MVRIMCERDLGDPVSGTYPEFRYPCPECHSRDNLAVNLEKRVGHCFGCDLRVYIKDVEDYHREHDLVDVARMFWDEDSIVSEKELPWCVISKELSPQARYYLNCRGISDEEISLYGIREGTGEYASRVLIPTIDEGGSVRFFVARDYTGTSQMRYLNPPKSICTAKDHLWGKNLIHGASVVVCEGVFSAIRANSYLGHTCSVATFGKVCKEEQVVLLLSMPVSVYWLCLDADADDETEKWAVCLSRTGRTVMMCKTPSTYGEHADICDMTKEQFLDNMRQGRRYSRLDSEL